MKRAATVRFWEKVDVRAPDACWPWTGTQDGRGYGMFDRDRASRFVLAETLARPIRPGYQAGHHCDNPICVNPRHVYECTPTENTRDKTLRYWIPRRPTACPQGHPYTTENTASYRRPGRLMDTRRCRTCEAERRSSRPQLWRYGTGSSRTPADLIQPVSPRSELPGRATG